jgi:Wzt C-terminal domain/2-oxoglutarate dehydrogenase N-terminus
VLELYERYREDPESVDEEIRKFFESWSPARLETNGRTPVIAGELSSTSTASEGVSLKEMDKGERVVVDFAFKVPLGKRRYSISAGVRAGSGDFYLDSIDVATSFRIALNLPAEIRAEVRVHTPEGERQGRSA